MKVFHRLQDLIGQTQNRSVAVGNFDGIHLGHAALIGRTVRKGRENGWVPSVLTFYPHPIEVLKPGSILERLTTTSEKLALLEQNGIESVFVVPFDFGLSQLSAEAFFKGYFLDAMHARSLHVGQGFHFGKDREGTNEVLRELCATNEVQLCIEEPVLSGGQRISSSRVRREAKEGNMELVDSLLGRPYHVKGPVVRGDGRGSQIGFPTANTKLAAEKLLPRNGVYVTRALWQRQAFQAVTNVGLRPTFAGSAPAPVVETHLLDFNANLYDEKLEIQFLHRLRDEQKFGSIDSLVHQIRLDVNSARAYFKEERP